MWRIYWPFAELRKQGYIAHSVSTQESDLFLPQISAGLYNVIVTPRIAWPDNAGLPWQRAIRKAGLCWVYEIDDDTYSPGIVDRQYRVFEHERAKGKEVLERYRQERIKVINQCDAITVSTKRLATIVRNYAPATTPIYVVPNVIDAKWFRSELQGVWRAPDVPKDKITIGWAGGTRDTTDLTPLLQAWRILAERYENVHFVMQGHITQMVDELPKHRRTTLPWLPTHEYPRAYVNYDIGCCIVAPNIFNTSKSAIKWYEFSLAGAACVVSPTVYGSEVTDGEDALVASSVDEWVSQLGRLIESEQLRREIAANARKTVWNEHSLHNNWHNWPAAWADAAGYFEMKRLRQLVTARA